MGFAGGATFVPTLEVARVLHGVQHVCQCASWHGVCMGKTGVDKCVGLCWTLRAPSTTRGTTQEKKVL